MKIIGVMACAQNGVVGLGSAIPWHYPDERKHFRNIIGTSPIIMGRKTFEVMPKNILKDRINVVLSRTHPPCLPRFAEDPGINNSPKGSIIFYNTPDDLPSLKRTTSWNHLFLDPQQSKEDSKSETMEVFMIGGAELANFFLEQKLLSEFILTKFHHSYKGDAILNIKAFDNWKSCIINETSDYCIYKLTP